MILEAIAESLISRVVDSAIERLSGKEQPAFAVDNVTITRDFLAMRDHLLMLNRWAAEIAFMELWKSKSLRESFVDLDLRLGIVRSQSDPSEDVRSIRVSDLPDLRGHHVLLGDPGAGKTTALKQVAAKLLQRSAQDPKAPIPILIRLRELGTRDRLTSTIRAILGIHLKFPRDATPQFRSMIEQRAVASVLEDLHCVLLIDGLDEVNLTARALVLEDLRYLFLRVESPRIVLTCRIGDYNYQGEGVQVLTIRPLSEAQIRQFTIRWLGADKATTFLERVRNNPYVGSEVRPLTLAHLCAIYERSGDVPEKPGTVYRKIVRLLLDEWDEQRGIQRSSRYGEFRVDRKEDFLEALAFQISVNFSSVVFTHTELRFAYLQIHELFGLPKSEVTQVVREIESHTGLILETASGQYEFTHKAIQEFLTASYIIKLPSLPSELTRTHPHEMALAVALSSHATRYCAEVIRTLLASDHITLSKSTDAFLHRMISQSELILLLIVN